MVLHIYHSWGQFFLWYIAWSQSKERHRNCTAFSHSSTLLLIESANDRLIRDMRFYEILTGFFIIHQVKLWVSVTCLKVYSNICGSLNFKRNVTDFPPKLLKAVQALLDWSCHFSDMIFKRSFDYMVYLEIPSLRYCIL